MGFMTKKHSQRVQQLEDELAQLESISKPRLKVQHRIKRLKEKDLPKARRHKG